DRHEAGLRGRAAEAHARRGGPAVLLRDPRDEDGRRRLLRSDREARGTEGDQVNRNIRHAAPLAALLAAPATFALAVDSTQPFGQDLGKALAKSKEKNVVFSPASIAQVLDMALKGSAGETKDEIAKALHGSPGALAH